VIKPSLCRMVLVLGPPAESNGASVAPAVITRVFSEHPDGGWTVNVTVFPDAAPPRPATSVRLVDDEDQARALLSTAAYTTAAYWPARV
jgi:hypothetical protein